MAGAIALQVRIRAIRDEFAHGRKLRRTEFIPFRYHRLAFVGQTE